MMSCRKTLTQPSKAIRKDVMMQCGMNGRVKMKGRDAQIEAEAEGQKDQRQDLSRRSETTRQEKP